MISCKAQTRQVWAVFDTRGGEPVPGASMASACPVTFYGPFSINDPVRSSLNNVQSSIRAKKSNVPLGLSRHGPLRHGLVWRMLRGTSLGSTSGGLQAVASRQ
jgi:hypothetical protein